MVANITSIGQTLSKTDETIKNLTSTTGDGKATLVTSNTVTQKIAEESASLINGSFKRYSTTGWLQSGLIPFVTAQTVRQNYTSVYSFDCNVAAEPQHCYCVEQPLSVAVEGRRVLNPRTGKRSMVYPVIQLD